MLAAMEPRHSGDRLRASLPPARRSLGRALLVPLLLGFVAVPACFAVLPPGEALDRWNIATGVIFALALGGTLVQLVRRATIPLALLGGLCVVIGAGVAHVALAGLPPIQDRRYCEAHQQYAHRTLQQAAAEQGRSSSCAGSARELAAWFVSEGGAHFSFHVERGESGCVYSAVGERYQAGCSLRLAAHADGRSDVTRAPACVDTCR